MKVIKRIAALMAAIMLITILPTAALAAGSIELDEPVSLTVRFHDGDVPMVGAEFSIYLVSTVDKTGELTPTEYFAGLPVDLDIRGENDEAWRDMAATLEGYVLRDKVSPTALGTTGADGQVTFPADEEKSLTAGLYLVLGKRHVQGGRRYDVSPYIVQLPALDKEHNTWDYQVEINSKYESNPDKPDTVTRKVLKVWKDEGHEKERPKEITVQLLRDGTVYDTVILNAGNNWRHTWDNLSSEFSWNVAEKALEDYTVSVSQEGSTFVVANTYDGNKPTTPAEPGTPSKPNLPQTGQLWWPVPVLLTFGLLMIVLGLARGRGGKHEE